MRPHIRAATSDDAVALSRFARDAFHDTFAADNAPGDMEAYLREAFSPERQAAELADPHRCCLLATVGGDLAGYASLMQDAAHPAVVAAHPVELERFYVARAWHGRGLSVACTNCHMDNGDYASDERKNKVIARQMERMQRDIDSKYIEKVKELDDPRPKTTCVMCHRGTPHMPNTMDVPTAPVPQRKR